MSAAATPNSTASTYRPALARFAALGSAWVFVLVTLGAFTTSIGAGMAFPDWPLSNGSVNPEGWLENLAMFAEHSHRLTGSVMGMITIGLAVWLWKTETRAWLKKLGWAALAIVVLQGVIGGKRVLLDGWYLDGVGMSVGQMLRIPHGILAHLYVCILFAIAASLSRRWIERPANAAKDNISCGLRFTASVCTLLVVIQLVIAATMRHNHAGLAIPTFPLTPEGGLIPAEWDYKVALHFAHRAMALVLCVALPWLAVRVWREAGAGAAGLRAAAVGLMGLLAVQVALGAWVIWSGRNPYQTSGHVVVGAGVLGLTFLLTWWLHREVIEGRATETATVKS